MSGPVTCPESEQESPERHAFPFIRAPISPPFRPLNADHCPESRGEGGHYVPLRRQGPRQAPVRSLQSASSRGPPNQDSAPPSCSASTDVSISSSATHGSEPPADLRMPRTRPAAYSRASW